MITTIRSKKHATFTIVFTFTYILTYIIIIKRAFVCIKK